MEKLNGSNNDGPPLSGPLSTVSLCAAEEPTINVVLSDDCLLSVLEQFSLTQLMFLRACCIRWRWLIESIIFRARRSLKLFYSEYDLTEYYCMLNQNYLLDDSDFVTVFQRNDLALPLPGGRRFPKLSIGQDSDDLLMLVSDVAITKTFCNWLSKLFPNVHNLVCWDLLFRNEQVMPHLLCKWKLDFCGLFKMYFSLQLLWSTIRDNLPQLRHLALGHIEGPKGTAKCYVNSSLEQLSIISINSRQFLSKIGPGIKRMALHSSYDCNHQLFNIIKMKGYLKKCLTHLTMHEVDLKLLTVICENLHALTQLEIIFEPKINLVQIASKLVLLKNLSTTAIHHSSCNSLLDNTTKCAFFNRDFPVIPTVKNLSLFIDFNFEDITGNLSIMQAIFPNTERLLLDVGIFVGMLHKPDVHVQVGDSIIPRDKYKQSPCSICCQELKQTCVNMFRFIYDLSAIRLYCGSIVIQDFLFCGFDDLKDFDFEISASDQEVTDDSDEWSSASDELGDDNGEFDLEW